MPPPGVRTLLFGNMYIAEDIDPQYAWDSASFDATMMVYECLLKNNLTQASLGQPMTSFPLLASDMGTYDVTGTELTFNLRQGITFHDGAQFNASAVKFSFDRLAYLMNVTGHPWGPLPNTNVYGTISVIDSLYRWGDGTPIINRTEVISNYIVKIILNKPHGVFRALLTFPAAAIMSPVSTPQLDFIDPALAGLDPLGIIPNPVAGTGPMILENIDTYEVRFSAYEDYWRPRIAIDVLVHVKITDSDTRNLAVMAGDVDLIQDPFDAYHAQMRTTPGLTLLDTGTTSAITSYMGINTRLYNVTWREAFSYAFNYSAVIDGIKMGNAVRMVSPVPIGIKWHNGTFDYATYDLAHARSVMNSMGFGVGFTDQDWIDQANGPSPFLTLNYTYNIGNPIREGIRDVVMDNFERIGVLVTDAGVTWEDYKDRFYNRRTPGVSHGWDSLNIYWLGWIPDYNDPENFINPMFSNISYSNACQINDPILETLMAAGIEETDEDMRRPLYMAMQKRLVEVLMPFMWGYHEINFEAFNSQLKGWWSNPISYNDLYGVYWEGQLNPGEFGYMGDGHIPLPP
ncbi:MAG: ABC transporter substrate-binding protein [Candidatus Hodarchaeota archaeon]